MTPHIAPIFAILMVTSIVSGADKPMEGDVKPFLGKPRLDIQQVFNDLSIPIVATETTAQTFLGIRLQCARCHNHPFDRWTQRDYYGMVNFFGRLGSKKSLEPDPSKPRHIVTVRGFGYRYEPGS